MATQGCLTATISTRISGTFLHFTWQGEHQESIGQISTRTGRYDIQEKAIFCFLVGTLHLNLNLKDVRPRKHPSGLLNFTRIPQTLLFCGYICCRCVVLEDSQRRVRWRGILGNGCIISAAV